MDTLNLMVASVTPDTGPPPRRSQRCETPEDEQAID